MHAGEIEKNKNNPVSKSKKKKKCEGEEKTLSLLTLLYPHFSFLVALTGPSFLKSNTRGGFLDFLFFYYYYFLKQLVAFTLCKPHRTPILNNEALCCFSAAKAGFSAA